MKCKVTLKLAMSLVVLSIGTLPVVARADQTGSCEIKITGARTVTVKGEKKPVPPNAPFEQVQLATVTNAQSDYWISDKHMRELIGVKKSFGKKLSPAELQTVVDAEMKKDPRLQALFVSCGDKNGSLFFQEAAGTKYANVPFKPGKYVLDPNGAAGTFNPNLTIGFGANADLFKASTAGVLELSQFDSRGVAGTFSFKAVKRFGGDEQIDVVGTFKYSCEGDTCGH